MTTTLRSVELDIGSESLSNGCGHWKTDGHIDRNLNFGAAYYFTGPFIVKAGMRLNRSTSAKASTSVFFISFKYSEDPGRNQLVRYLSHPALVLLRHKKPVFPAAFGGNPVAVACTSSGPHKKSWLGLPPFSNNTACNKRRWIPATGRGHDGVAIDRGALDGVAIDRGALDEVAIDRVALGGVGNA